MKHIVLVFFTGFLIIALSNKAQAIVPPLNINDSIVYVWDFSVSDVALKPIATMLTNDFETELINSGLYTVLERRRFNRVLAHQNLGKEISDVKKIPIASKDSLEANRAGVVIFGEVKDDIDSGVYEVTVTFQSLNEVILRKGSILIGRGLIRDNQTRKKFMKDLVDLVHAKELLAAKKRQYDLISGVLATYMVRVKDVQNRFQDISRFAFDDKNYFEELGKTIFAYNDVFDTLTANRAKYHLGFIKYWEEPRGQELEAIFKGILDDIHVTYILKLDKVRLAIWEYGESTGGKKEKQKIRNDILKSVKTTTDDLERQIDIMHGKINPFLSHLRVEISE
ncbi:hypothetical protein [Arenibacter certesii]|uniref:Uncharacterized protein n=1 Tax=Arenibacter certesii TaxID=228955 RepID=A0A918ML64_9FLAO|nr:hypothetical protein [Arenibacter certesii]GGW37084.1 hypothetical protein GCM10007383_22430 [Arenibacter certesii]